MAVQNVNQDKGLTEQNKVVSLFQFIQELNKLKQKAVLNVKDYPWFFSLSKLPDDPENIKLQYRDRVETEEAGLSSTILSVHKPEFQKCPEIDPLFKDWLLPGWEDYKREVGTKETLEPAEKKDKPVFNLLDEIESEKPEPEHFSDNGERVAAFEKWRSARSTWAEKQRLIAQTRDLFSNLYRLFFELQKESETEEIIVATGMLFDRENSDIRHPVLTHRVELNYDPDRNTVFVNDTEASSELYSVVFQLMENINLSGVNQLNADLQANDYHPLDRNDTPGFLKVLVHQLSSDSLFVEGTIPEQWKDHARLLLVTEPCIIVRKRLDGTLKAIEQIIENIQDTGEIPAPIHDIVSGGIIEVPEDVGEPTIEEQLAEVGGESIDILLSKEANKEQLEIARRIERYNAVLVQGPPGTGKTHTIANLLGHFLAQGKSVLVTSYTKKALSVLKGQVAPGLQSLCVSILDDSNVDMERSVDGITEYMSRTTSFEVKKEMDSIARDRKAIIDRLADVRRKIFGIISQERGSIVLNGVEISPSEAAAFVCSRAGDLAYIPGNVRLRSPLPLSFEQLTDLYKSNDSITQTDEDELKCKIPNPTGILSPADFEHAWTTIQLKRAEVDSIAKDKQWGIGLSSDCNSIKFTGQFGEFSMPLPTKDSITNLKDYVASFGTIEQWMKCAAVDGKNGGAYRQRWITLIDQIRNTCKKAEEVVTEQFGRTISFKNGDIESLQGVFTKIRDIFAEKRKLSKMTLMIHKDINPALEQVSIDGHQVRNEDECNIVLHEIELIRMRKQCAVYWDELLGANGVPNFFELDKNKPEAIASNWLSLIERYLDWYKTDYDVLETLLIIAGFPVDAVFSRNALDSDLIATGKILGAVDDIIPALSDSCLDAIEIRNMSVLIDNTRRSLISGQLVKSITCQNLVRAINNHDCSGYVDAYAALESLYRKYDLQSKRKELLKELEPYAPQWAEAIRARSGVHGQPVLPDDIEDAWRWKQLSGIIAEITKQPFDQLQEESLRLSKEYRKTTAKYAEKSGWYHLLKRTEADIDMKQALQGWKLTVKKIGKGTGKTAPMYKAKARDLMTKCQRAVPAWIMPINRALESLNPKTNRFDIIIIDEASQSDVSSLAILYMGKKLIIVGDDKQVSPMAVGVEADKMTSLEQMYIKGKIPNSHLYNAKTSIYDIAATTFQPLMLREHFRCVPEIIGFSNMLSYDYKIKPLRDASSSALLPAVVNYRVENGFREGKTNPNEAKTIVALMQACIDQPEYAEKSMGVISLLGDEQVRIIQQLIEQKIDAKEIISRKILCGNSANFQGDERDVLFLSVVDSSDGTGPIHMLNYGPDDSYRKRYNVAASRAKDQLWVVDSLDSSTDLKPGDIRKMLIDYSINPQAVEIRKTEIEERAESPFEARVANSLADRGYHLVQQWKVGAYRLDIVAVCGKKTVAIECDGERWHSSEAKIREDMERQTILERLGWRFIRIRGSEYYSNPDEAISRVINELNAFGIEPESSSAQPETERETELLRRVKQQAGKLLELADDEPRESMMATIASALNPATLISSIITTPVSDTAVGEKKENSVQHTIERGNNVVTVKTKQQVNGKKAAATNTTTTKTEAHKTSVTVPKETVKPKTRPVPQQQSLFPKEDNRKGTTKKDDNVIAFLKKNGVKYIDKRQLKGALWIVGGHELDPIVKQCRTLGVYFNFMPEGGKQTNHKPGWWAK